MSSFRSLDSEALDQVLVRLQPEDVLRLGCSCSQLYSRITTGRHALQLWLAYCKQLLGEVPLAHVAAAACEADTASTWMRLYAAARLMDQAHWSPAAPSLSCFKLVDGAQAANTVHNCPAADTAEQHAQARSQHHLDPAAALARSGHTATAAGRFVVLVGGDLRDGPAQPVTSDVAVLDLANSRIIRPRLHGQHPPSLRHHCTVLLHPADGSALQKQVSSAIAQALTDPQQQQPRSSSPLTPAADTTQQLASAGFTLAVFGGLLPDGTEQATAQAQLHILWLHADASWGVWLQPDTLGPAPAPRAYACCAGVYGGTQLLVYAGWVSGSISGTVQADVRVVDGYLLLCVYLLDTATLTWSRVPTRPLNEPPRPGHVMLGPSTCPGPRKEALSCLRLQPSTGREEFVLLGGCGVDGLADFVPYSLDLESFTWTKGPVVGYLPPARGQCTVMQVTPSWLLLLGGQSPTREALTDIQRLHLPTLSWRPPVHVVSTGSIGSSSAGCAGVRGAGLRSKAGPQQQGAQADASSCTTVGCTATAGVVLGGVHEGPYGSSIVPRLQVLLPGPVIPASAAAAPAAAAFPAHPSATGAPNGLTAVSQTFSSRSKPALLMGPTAATAQHEQQPLWHALASSSCRCGSCCSCLSAKAAASGATSDSDVCSLRDQRGGLQEPGTVSSPPVQQRGCVPRWQVVNEVSSAAVMQGPVGWSGEFEIEPAPSPPRCTAAAGSHAFPQAGKCSLAGVWGLKEGVEPAVEAERVWQTTEGGSNAWGMQAVLALVVVLLGLVLMTPTWLMHQGV